MSPLWYVVRSKPNKEMALWRELTARGLECFYPQLRVRPVNPRSRRIRSYFPGYLFLHTDIEQIGVSTLQWMPFSSGVVSFDSMPAFDCEVTLIFPKPGVISGVSRFLISTAVT